VVLTAVLSSSAQIGAKSNADPRLRKTLNSVALKYSEMKDGDFKLHFSVDDERTHLVFAESKTTTLGIIEVREV
jgi:hypothetical protein